MNKVPAWMTWLCLVCGCSSSGAPDNGNPIDAAVMTQSADASVLDLAPSFDAARPECEWGGAPGRCLAPPSCAAIADHSSEPGSCAAGLGCCIDTPDVADDPPTPAGYKPMMQSQVTPAMTAWAVAILHDPIDYPMYSTATMSFGTQFVLALVEWHVPDFQNSVVHRGVTLFIPIQ